MEWEEKLNVRQSEIAEWVLPTVAAGGGFKGFEIHLCCLRNDRRIRDTL